MAVSTILRKDKPELNGDNVTILNYTPTEFNFGTPEAALEYIKSKETGETDFVMSDVLRTTTGVEEIERASEEKMIEEKVLHKISSLQEDAYKKAYELGFEEGTKKAFESKKADLTKKGFKIDDLLLSLIQIKEELIYQNEAHIIKMIYEIASKLAMDHVTEHKEVVLKIIKKSIEDAQADENINVIVSSKVIEFLEQVKAEEKRENEFLKKVKFVASNELKEGSCIVETNYGIIDARIEERISKLWDEFKQAMPKVKSPIESA